MRPLRSLIQQSAKGQQPRCGPKMLDSPAVERVNVVLECGVRKNTLKTYFHKL